MDEFKPDLAYLTKAGSRLAKIVGKKYDAYWRYKGGTLECRLAYMGPTKTYVPDISLVMVAPIEIDGNTLTVTDFCVHLFGHHFVATMVEVLKEIARQGKMTQIKFDINCRDFKAGQIPTEFVHKDDGHFYLQVA